MGVECPMGGSHYVVAQGLADSRHHGVTSCATKLDAGPGMRQVQPPPGAVRGVPESELLLIIKTCRHLV